MEDCSRHTLLSIILSIWQKFQRHISQLEDLEMTISQLLEVSLNHMILTDTSLSSKYFNLLNHGFQISTEQLKIHLITMFKLKLGLENEKIAKKYLFNKSFKFRITINDKIKFLLILLKST